MNEVKKENIENTKELEPISHEGDILKISSKVFDKKPTLIERMKVGMANEVYLVRIDDIDYIFRLNEDQVPLRGSDKYIPLFRSLGIKVPEIISEDYSKEITPYNYQIQTRLPGVDIDKVITELSEKQLADIAAEIASIIKKLRQLPTNGKYGYADISETKLKSNWAEVISEMLVTIRSRASKTGLVDQKYITAFENAFEKYRIYFEGVPSTFYFDDMSSKNVIVDNGKFSGIVDLDGVGYGDPLEAVGRIKASWYGTKHGTSYTNFVMKELGLDDSRKEIVTVYALLNRIYWLAEKGIQFNQNTPKIVDMVKVSEDKKVIDGLVKELDL